MSEYEPIHTDKIECTFTLDEETRKAIAATQQMQADETAKAIAEQEDLRVAIAKFQDTFQERTYSQRNPDLGKMVNCAVCGMRHRSSQVCEQRFAKVRIGHSEEYRQTEAVNPKRRFGMGAGKRINPHFCWRRLQIVDLTKQLFPYYTGDDAVQKAKSKAMNILFPIWGERDRIRQQMQKESRAINRSI
jgi:hypothetical protein